MEWQCLSVNLREDNKGLNTRWQCLEFNMAEFKMAAIIKLSQNEWDQVEIFVQNGWIQDGQIQDGCHHQAESEWVSEVFLCKWWGGINVRQSFFVQNGGNPFDGKCEWVWEEKLRWLNPRWPNLRWLPSSSWVRMNEFESDWISFSQSFVQNGWISRWQKSRWLPSSSWWENEWVWFRLN